MIDIPHTRSRQTMAPGNAVQYDTSYGVQFDTNYGVTGKPGKIDRYSSKYTVRFITTYLVLKMTIYIINE